jgi:hypothetical protein
VTFPESVVAAVLAHMNDDHTHDSLLIVRAFARPDAVDATMTGFDGGGGVWSATTADGTEEVRVAWPAAPIAERAEVRREIVALYDAACERLGVEARPH